MKHYLLLPKVFLCCVAVGVLSACEAIIEIPIEMAVEAAREASREVDTRGAWGVKTAKNKDKPILPKKMIKRGKTTKGEVLAMLSNPEEKTSDDRFFLYRYEIQIHKVRKKDNIVVERIPEDPLREAHFLIWFDQTDIVKRYRWRECKRTLRSDFLGVDPFLKCHSANQMCEMIKRLKDEQLIAEYC
jgi:hypothetical protein